MHCTVHQLFWMHVWDKIFLDETFLIFRRPPLGINTFSNTHIMGFQRDFDSAIIQAKPSKGGNTMSHKKKGRIGKNKFKEGIKPYLKDKVCKRTFIIVLAIILIFLPLLYFTGHLIIEEKMLFWLFAATSQSMAALFAIVGMFAVFRYQDIQNRLRNKIDVLKEKFQSGAWNAFFGYTETYSWDDSEIIDRAKEKLREKEDEEPHVILNNLDVDITIIESHMIVRDFIRVIASIPMISILLTFMISIFSLPFTVCLSENCLGLVILIVILVLITSSMISVFKYFMISVPPR